MKSRCESFVELFMRFPKYGQMKLADVTLSTITKVTLWAILGVNLRQFSVDNSPSTIRRRKIHRRKIHRRKIHRRKIHRIDLSRSYVEKRRVSFMYFIVEKRILRLSAKFMVWCPYRYTGVIGFVDDSGCIFVKFLLHSSLTLSSEIRT